MTAPYDSTELPWRNLTDEETERLVKACECFERAWENGAPPRIEDFVRGSTGEYRRALLVELIRLEVDYLPEASADPRPATYHDRFPDDHDAIAEAFKDDRPVGLTVRTPQSPNESSEEPPLPKAIDRYRIIEEIGRGGAGRVLLAQEMDLERRVAIKLLRTDLSQPALLDSLLKEAKQVAKLDHRYVAQVYTCGTYNGDVYVVYKLIDGQTLYEWVAEHHPTYDRVALVMARIAEALAYIHIQGMVHRDIKPNNIIVTGDDRPILIDFGLALSRADAAHADPGMICGTPEFLSPEQVEGNSDEVDGRTDIYSLGATLYKLLTGHPPFECLDLSAFKRLKEQILAQRFQPPRQLNPDIPKELERICLKAMVKDYSRRYSCATDLQDDLLRFIKESEVDLSGALPSTIRQESGTTTQSIEPSTSARAVQFFEHEDASRLALERALADLMQDCLREGCPLYTYTQFPSFITRPWSMQEARQRRVYGPNVQAFQEILTLLKSRYDAWDELEKQHGVYIILDKDAHEDYFRAARRGILNFSAQDVLQQLAHWSELLRTQERFYRLSATSVDSCA